MSDRCAREGCGHAHADHGLYGRRCVHSDVGWRGIPTCSCPGFVPVVSEPEQKKLAWSDLSVGDVFEIDVFCMQEGNRIEKREVVGINGDIFTLTGDPGRPGVAYTVDVSTPKERKRRLAWPDRKIESNDHSVVEPGQNEAGDEQGSSAVEARGLPARIVVDAKGFYWRDFGEFYSMCPVNPDNSPIPQPVVYYVPAGAKGTDRFGALRAAIGLASAEEEVLNLGIEEEIPEDLRYELMRLAGSVNDFIFWIRRKAQEDDLGGEPADQMYNALEIESGVDVWGVTAREAVDNYFRSDVLGLPRSSERPS